MKDDLKSSTLTVMLLLAGLFSGLVAPVSADIEPINNDLNTTEVLAPGTAMPGTLNSTDNDHYKFAVVSAQNISAKLVFDSGSGTIFGDLFGPDKSRIGGTGSFAVGLTAYYNFTTSTASAGDYYFKVASSSNAFYNLTVTMSMQNDAGSGTDAGDADTNPFPLTGGAYNGYIGNDDDYDFYSFAVTNAQVMTINLTTGTLKTSDLYIDLFSPTKSRITGTGDVNPGVSKGFNYTTSITSAGTYYLKVAGGDNDYSFSVILTNQNDLGLGLDAADTDISPTLITPDVTGDGWISNQDSKDLYGFTVDSGKKVVLTLTTGTVRSDDLYVDLYNPAKYRMTGTGDVKSGITKTISFTTSSSVPGLYYVIVAGGANAYTLRVNLVSQTDGGSTGDAPDDFPGLSVTGCSPCGGWISNDDTKDHYAVNLTNGQIVTLNLTVGSSSTTNDLYLDIYDPLKSRLTGTGDVNPGVTGSLRYTSSFETPGLYQFLVSGGSNDYNVTMDIEDQDDAGTGMDAPEAFDDAVPLDTGSYEGWQEDADSVDTYNVTVFKGNVFTVNLTTGTGGALSMTATIYDATRNSIKSLISSPGLESTWTLEDGKKPTADSTYYIKVFYGAGNHYTLDIDLPYIPPDTTQPVLSISSPSSGALTNAGTATIMGTASDDSGTVAIVETSLNSGPFVPCVGTDNWTTTVLLNDGTNTIMVRAKDLAGNEVANTMTIIFDGTPPSMNLTTPATRTVKGTAATIGGTATDDMSVESVDVMVNGGNWTAATGTTNWTVAVTLVKGPNTILVRVTDTAGNSAQVSYTITSEKETSDRKSSSPGFEGAVLFCAVVVGLALLARRRLD